MERNKFTPQEQELRTISNQFGLDIDTDKGRKEAVRISETSEYKRLKPRRNMLT